MAPVASSPYPVLGPLPPSLATKDRAASRKRFEDVYSIVRDDLLDDFRKHNMPEEVMAYYRRSMDYNVPGGKLNRGMSVVDSVAILKGRDLNESEYFKAAVLGWSVEWLQAYFLVSDDIMDGSVTRRGKACWYLVEGVGLMAVNDALILEGAIFQMIRKHFRNESFYLDLLDLLHEVSYQTEMGQLIDLITAPEGRVDLSKFSLDRHKTIVTYKTASIPFTSPSLSRSSSADSPSRGGTHQILTITNDYLDYAGTPDQIGKVGTDIMDNKCSWCINKALAHASDRQRRILEINYGHKDPAMEARVKEVFSEIGVDAMYSEYEADAYARINALIDSVPETTSPSGDAVLRRDVFRVFLEKIYKRTK
ncbi:farnesyl diphosphate synthase [Lactifluus volemus]|nr:farnesyl diphosphate synthase [Lactifluus volemus]